MEEFQITNMNVHNGKNGSFESPPKGQFKMQSCKLNKSESRPNIALRRIGQELNKAETKCFTLQSELNYMMEVCQKAQTEIRGNKETSNMSQIILSSKNPGSKFLIEENDYNSESTVANKTPNYDISQRTNIELKTEKNFDILNLSSKSARFSTRKNIDDIIKRSESLTEGKQKGLLNVTIIPRKQLDKKLPPAITTMPAQNKTMEAGGEYENYYFPSSMSVEEVASQADEDYFNVMPCSARRANANPGLNLDTNIARARRAEKSKSKTRSETNSVYRTDNAMSKARKRKAKLPRSISKSTVTTKDTGFIGKKEAKRRRHRGRGVVHQQSSPPKHLKKFNDVVEVFHNTISNSRMSSKPSKLDGVKYGKKSHFPETADRKIQEASCSERVNHECQFHDKKNEQDHCLQTLNYQSKSEPTPENDAREQDKSEKHSNDLDPSAQDETRRCEHAFNRYDDPMFMPSYEMPTLASKLKRSSRLYLNRFNFRSIPFVVGTSVTPSHNLGLNIQQVWSVMKTRQPIANDVTPLLIRKVSRGMKPVSSLLEQMNGHYEGSILDVSSQIAGTFNNGDSLGRHKRLSVFNLQNMEKTQSACTPKVSIDTEIISEKDNNISKQLCKEKGDSCDHKIKQQSSSKSNTSANPKSQKEISRISKILKSNIGDHKIRIAGSRSSKEIRDILINLHDQFEEMNTKYEKLQSEVDKSNDKALAKELSALEKKLNAKEEEINAVIGLYKEVMTLKQQMKMLHEKNSLICIATESTKKTHKDPFPASIVPGKSHSMNPAQMFGRRKICNTTREPPTSMQLAALLRQIQTFHKQLQLVS